MNSNKDIYEKIIKEYENSFNFVNFLLRNGYKVTLENKTYHNNSLNLDYVEDDLNDFLSSGKELTDTYIESNKKDKCKYIKNENNDLVGLDEIKDLYNLFHYDLSEDNCYNKYLRIDSGDGEVYYAIPYLKKISKGDLFFNETERYLYDTNKMVRIIKKYIDIDISVDEKILGQYLLADSDLKRKLEEQYKELRGVEIALIKEYLDAENDEDRMVLESKHGELKNIAVEINKNTFPNYFFEQTGSIVFSVKNGIPYLNDINHIGINEFKEIAVGNFLYDVSSDFILESSNAVELFKNLIIANENKDNNRENNISNIAKFNATTYIKYNYDNQKISLITTYDIPKTKDSKLNRTINNYINEFNSKESEIVFDNVEDFFTNGDNYLDVIQSQYFKNLHSTVRKFESNFLGIYEDSNELDITKKTAFDDMIFNKIIQELREVESGDYLEKDYLSKESVEILQNKIKSEFRKIERETNETDLSVEEIEKLKEENKEKAIKIIAEENYFNKHLLKTYYGPLTTRDNYKNKLNEGKIELNDLVDAYVEIYIKDLTFEEFIKKDNKLLSIRDEDLRKRLIGRTLNQLDSHPRKMELFEESVNKFRDHFSQHIIKSPEFEELFDLNNSELRDDIILSYLNSENEFDMETNRLEELKKFYKKSIYGLNEQNYDDYEKIKTIERRLLVLLNSPVSEENHKTLSELIYDTNRKNFNKFVENENKSLEDKLDLVLNNIDDRSVIYAKGNMTEVSIIKIDENNFELDLKYGILKDKSIHKREDVLKYLKAIKDDTLLENLESSINDRYSIYNAGNLLRKYHDNDNSIVKERNNPESLYSKEYESTKGYNDSSKYLERISKGETCIIRKLLDKRNEEEFFLIKTEKDGRYGNKIYIQSIRANRNIELEDVKHKDLIDGNKFTIKTKAVNTSELKTFLENKTDRNYYITCKDYDYKIDDFLKGDNNAIKTLGKIVNNSSFEQKPKQLTSKIHDYVQKSKVAIYATGDKDGKQRKMYKFEENDSGSIDLKIIAFPKDSNGVPYTMTFTNALEYNKTTEGPSLLISNKYKSGNNLFKNCFNELLTNEDQIDKLRVLFNDLEGEESRKNLIRHLTDNFDLLYSGSQNHALNKEFHKTNGYKDTLDDSGVKLNAEELREVNDNYRKLMNVKSLTFFDKEDDAVKADDLTCKAYNDEYINKFKQIIKADSFDSFLSNISTSSLKDKLETLSNDSEGMLLGFPSF